MKLNNPHPLLGFLFVNLMTACVYFSLGYIGTLLATQPANASPVWPASGFALAMVLVYGKRVIPGVFIGAVTISTYSFLDYSVTDVSNSALITGFFSSLGSSGQAFVGAYLINRFVGQSDPLIEDSKIIHFFLLGGLLSCFLTPTVAVSSMLLQDIISFDDVLITWGTWWIGDSIGVIIFTPLVLSFIVKDSSLWKERQKLVTYPLLFMLFLVISIFQYNQKQETQLITSIFERKVNSFQSILDNEIQLHVEINQFLKGFFDSSKGVSKEEFLTMTDPIINKHSGIQALEWISAIPAEHRQQFENDFFSIREPDQQKNMTPAKSHLMYFPITYVQPLDKNQRALGFNAGSNPIALRAMQKARGTGKTSISEPLQLAQDLVKKTALVIYSPVYFKNKPTKTIEDRRKALQGFTTSVFRIEDELKEIASHFPFSQLLIKITDQDVELYNDIHNMGISYINHLSLKKVTYINVADRVWKLTYQPSSGFYHSQLSWTIWWLLLGSLIVTGLTAIGLLMLTGRTLRTEQLVSIRTQALAESEAQFRELVQAQSAIVWRGNPDTFQFTFVSNEAENILGYSVDEWLNNDQFWMEHIHEDDRKWAYDYCIASTQQLKSHEFEYRMISKSGEIVWFRDIVNIVEEDGKAKELFGLMIDVTARRNTEEITKLTESKYKILFDNAIEAFVIIDLERLKFIDANENALALFGMERDAFYRIGPWEVSPSIQPNGLSSDEQAKYNINKALTDGSYTFEWTHLNKLGEEILCEINLAVLPSLENKMVVGSISDITEQKKSEQEVYDLAFYDHLTGLANRRLLLSQLNVELPAAKRNAKFGAIIFLDLDRFKILNDSLGHHVGDQLLIQVAQRISTVLRTEDLAARFGGDEFVILIRADEATLQQATESTLVIAEKIRDTLQQPYLMDDYEHQGSASIGITLFPEFDISADELLQQADKAMYRSKEHGRNRVSFFHPSLQKAADAKLFLEKELRLAIKNQDFILYYQPQTDVTGNTLSSEALIRWQHAERGLISPADFIPVAEESELIISLGAWVLNQACAQMRSWLNEGMELHHISVNVSSKQFRQADFVSLVEETIKNNKLLASHLFIELTEGVMIDNIGDTIEKMQALKKIGVKIAIDDFGTGYSSLAYLKQLPLDQLKIDQSFVRDISTDNNNDGIIVETIINMARNLKLDVIAEGVETQKQKDFLLEKGCFIFQGYYFSRPLSAEQFKRFFNKGFNL